MSLVGAVMPRSNLAAGFRYFLHKEDCSGAVLSCFSGRQGDDSPIGISNDPMTSFNVNGKFGESLPVEQGETYFLVIDNQDNNNAGFNLQFAGTAVIGDQTLNAVIAEPSILNCVENTLTLNTAGTSTGDQYEYTWELDGGNFLDTSNLLSPVLDAAGEYTLMVEDTRSKCRTSTFVRVNDDSELPLAEAGDRFTLSCTTPQFELSGAGSSIGNIFTYEWSTIDGGNFVGSNTAIISIIDRPGTYILAVTDTTNQCTETDTVIISESMDIPDLLVDSSTISCTNPTVELIATSTTDDVSYSWLGEDLSAPFMGSNFTTGVPGIYTVTVTAPNGCTKTTDALIKDDRIFPTTLAGEYEWRTQNGHFVEGTTLTNLTPQVDSAGIYILEITNASNGCVAEDTVTIQKAFELPTVSLNSPTLLTCFDETITIDASPSDSGAIYDFNWIANEGGSFQSGTTTYHPVLNRGGLYVFTLNNLETGCTNQDSVRILESQDKPNLVTTEGIVTCTSPSVALSARSDTSGVTFEWTSTLLDTNRSGDSLIINLPGEYQVTALAPNGCRTQKTLVVADDRLSPTLTVSDNDTLTCSITGLDLEANSSTPNTTFAWIPPNGDSIAGNQILATESGSYLQIATAPNGCTTQDTVQIFNDENAPVAKIELPNPLTCNADFILLDAGLNSSSGPQFRYTWTTVEGQFKNPVAINDLQVEVQQEGIYELSVHDSSNNCETKTSIEVSDIREFPTILLNKSDIDTLSCLDTTLQYTVNTNANIPIYEWTLQGIQLSDTDELTITQPGEYGLKITDQENNCPSKKEILIRIDTIAPVANVGTPQTLNCAVGSVSLDGTNSSQGDQFTYLWTNETGATIGTDLVTEIDKAGLYNLRVINTRSGCRTQEEVLISAALDNPIAAAGPDTIL